jgi:hypothetical protein
MPPKNQESAPDAVNPDGAQVAGDFPLSLSEFCQRLSTSDRRVELIAAFHHAETGAGHGQDTEANYRARFEAFVTQPA